MAAFILLSILAVPEVRERLSDFFWPPPNVRLAILPVEGAANGQTSAEECCRTSQTGSGK